MHKIEETNRLLNESQHDSKYVPTLQLVLKVLEVASEDSNSQKKLLATALGFNAWNSPLTLVIRTSITERGYVT